MFARHPSIYLPRPTDIHTHLRIPTDYTHIIRHIFLCIRKHTYSHAPVPFSCAETVKIPLASISKVTSIWGVPLGAGGMPVMSNCPSLWQSLTMARSPSYTAMFTTACTNAVKMCRGLSSVCLCVGKQTQRCLAQHACQGTCVCVCAHAHHNHMQHSHAHTHSFLSQRHTHANIHSMYAYIYTQHVCIHLYTTCMHTCIHSMYARTWLSEVVVKPSVFLVGITVLRSMSLVSTPPWRKNISIHVTCMWYMCKCVTCKRAQWARHSEDKILWRPFMWRAHGVCASACECAWRASNSCVVYVCMCTCH